MWGKIQSAAIKGWSSVRPGAEAARHGERLQRTARALGEVCWRRRLVILAGVALALAASTAYVAGAPRWFEAATLVATADRAGAAAPPAAGIEDQLRLIASRTMAARLVDRLDLQLSAEFNPVAQPGAATGTYDFGTGGLVPNTLREQLPAAWADALGGAPPAPDLTDEQQAARLRDHVVAAVMARIQVEPAEPSVVRVTFLSEDPGRAAAAANALAELYLDDQATSERQTDGLEREIDRLTASIDATEKALAELRATAAAAPDQPGEQDLLDLTAERELWRAERAEVEARLQAVAVLKADPSPDGTAALLESERLGQLQARAGELERQLAELSPGLDEQDPQVASLRGELVALEDERRGEIELTAARLEQEAAIIGARETALEAKIEAFEKELGDGRDANGTEALERQLEAERELLRTYVDRLERGQLPGETIAPDARIVVPAVAPQTPRYPRVLLLYGIGLCAGLFAGIVLACALEARQRRAAA